MLETIRSKPKQQYKWVLWWRVDQIELQDQVEKYSTLGWFEAARKLSVLCLLFSTAITALFILFKIADAAAYFDALTFLVLAAFIYRGHRWAMIAAMALWTFEKIAAAIPGWSSLPPNGGSIVVSFFWWTAYMHAFYLAYRVEQLKRKPPDLDSGNMVGSEGIEPPATSV